MKITFTFLLFILCGITTAQNYTKVNLGADQYAFYQLPGAKEKIKGIQHIEVFFAFKNDGSSDSLYIVGVYPDMKKNTEQQVLVGFISGEEAMFNSAKMYDDPFYRNDTIYISSQVPFKATFITLRLVWNDKTKMFEPVESTYEDSSWEKLSEGDSLLAKGNIDGAIYLYEQMEYPMSYMNEYSKGREIMKKAHEMAMISFRENKYEESVTYILSAFRFWTNELYIGFTTKEEFNAYLIDEYGEKWTLEEVKLWLGDYGLFLYKAGSTDKSIEINKYLTMILPDVAGPYLQLADSYFDSGNKINAKETYKKYSDLMKKLKREKEIPKRVKERMK